MLFRQVSSVSTPFFTATMTVTSNSTAERTLFGEYWIICRSSQLVAARQTSNDHESESLVDSDCCASKSETACRHWCALSFQVNACIGNATCPDDPTSHVPLTNVSMVSIEFAAHNETPIIRQFPKHRKVAPNHRTTAGPCFHQR